MRAAWLVAGVAFVLGVGRAAAAEDESAAKIELGGKVFARLESSSADDYARSLSIPNARLSVDAKWKGLLRATLEADLASASLLKDAFVEVKPGAGFGVKAGRFKAPFSARELTSKWKLDLVDRGVANDVARGGGVAGRMIGLELGWRPRFLRALKVCAAGFSDSSRKESVAGRVELRHSLLTIGANAFARELGEAGLALGGDAALHSFVDLSVEGLRIPGDDAGPTHAATALLSHRFELPADLHLRPLLGVEWLWRPAGAPLHAVTGGVNLGSADRLRLQLQLTSGALSLDGSEGRRFVAQLGAHF